MSMAWLGLSLLLATRTVSGNFEIPCGPTRASWIDSMIAPARMIVSKFLHHGCPAQSAGYDSEKLQIATWPQYANISSSHDTITAHIQGFAFESPPCAFQDSKRRELLARALSLTGGDISRTDDEAMMPINFLSYAVSRAAMSIDNREIHLFADASTNDYGHFDGFATLPIPSGLGCTKMIRKSTMNITMLTCNEAPKPSAATAFKMYMIPPNGLTIVSDVDDILRVAEIWNFKQILLTTFARPFEPWLDIPKVFTNWQQAVPEAHFHYVTDAPEMLHEFYTRGIKGFYPDGTFDFRAMEYGSFSQLISPRYANIKRLLQTFPNRKYVLIGDTSTGSTVSSYVKLAEEYPQQIQCIIMRDISATEPANWIVPNLKHLRRLQEKYIIFATPKDLDTTTHLMKALERSSLLGTANVGCNGIDIDTRTSDYGNIASWMHTISRAVGGYYQCFVLLWHRPHMACPLDRRERVWYWHGGYEPVHDTAGAVRDVHDLPSERPLLRQRTKLRPREL